MIRTNPSDEEAMENLARYIVRASFSQVRTTYLPEEAKVIYKSKGGNQEKVFDALEWLAAMLDAAKRCEDGCSHVPNKGEQMVRYYGLCKALHKPYYAEFIIMLSNLDNGFI